MGEGKPRSQSASDHPITLSRTLDAPLTCPTPPWALVMAPCGRTPLGVEGWDALPEAVGARGRAQAAACPCEVGWDGTARGRRQCRVNNCYPLRLALSAHHGRQQSLHSHGGTSVALRRAVFHVHNLFDPGWPTGFPSRGHPVHNKQRTGEGSRSHHDTVSWPHNDTYSV